MKLAKLAATVCCGLALAVGAPLAAMAAGDTYDLGVLNVTAEESPTEAASITTVLTEEQIRDTNAKTVTDALAYAPGVAVTTGKKNQPEVRIHGFDQSHILVLIDGVPYYETYYGKLNLDQIPIDIISKIIITKDAPSVLYGANAQVAVINIVTKQGTDTPQTTLTAEAGSHDSYKASVSHGYKVGKLNYWLNYTRNQSDGWELSGDYTARPGTIREGKFNRSEVIQPDGKRLNSDFSSDNFWARLGFQPSEKTDIFLNLHYIDSDRGVPPSIDYDRVFPGRAGFSDFTRYTKYNDMGTDLSARHELADWVTIKATMFYHEHEDDYTFYDSQYYNNPYVVSTFEDYTLGGSIWLDMALLDSLTSRFAVHYKGDSHKSRDDEYLPLAESFSNTGSAAVELEWKPVSKLSLVAGTSYDWFDVTKAQDNVLDDDNNLEAQVDLDTPGISDEFNPMIGASWQALPGTRVFGSVARKTRFPLLSQLFGSSSGNKDLKAETSINYTLGLSQQLGSQVGVELAGFYHDVSDWISRDGPYVDSIYRNYGKIHTYGFEFGVTYQPLKRLNLGVYYTYTKAEDKSDDAVTDHVIRVPEHEVVITADYMIPVIETKLHASGLFMGEMYSSLPTPTNPTTAETKNDGYFLLNLRVSKKFWEHYEGWVAANNIFDKDYESEAYFPGPGANYWVGVSMNW